MRAPRTFFLQECRLADADQARHRRTYAHTFHRAQGRICVARAFFALTADHQLGILAHEVGHLLAGPEESEEGADAMANSYFGIELCYHDCQFGRDVQVLSPQDTIRVLQGPAAFRLRGARRQSWGGRRT